MGNPSLPGDSNVAPFWEVRHNPKPDCCNSVLIPSKNVITPKKNVTILKKQTDHNQKGTTCKSAGIHVVQAETTERAQYGFVREYTLNWIGFLRLNMIQGYLKHIPQLG